MKFKNIPTKCHHCNTIHDSFLASCPHCGKANPIKDLAPGSKKIFWMDYIRQLAVFLLGFIGFAVISSLISTILVLIIKANNSEEIANAMISSKEIIMVLNALSYCAILTIFIFILYPYLNDLFKSFLRYKNVLKGLGFGVILVMSSLLYGMIVSSFPGAEEIPGNANQDTVVKCVLAFPITSILLFGIAGPFVEEVTYRLGCFTFFNRFNRIIAYLITTIIFAFIHFNFTAGSKEAYLVELINIPSYIIGAVILCLAYEKGGFSCSVTAHVFNNLFSIFQVLILSSIM